MPHFMIEKSKPYLCAPACLNMVFARFGLPTFPQDYLAEKLQLVVPIGMHGTYPFAQSSDQPADWGVHLTGDTGGPDLIPELLAREGIPLHYRYVAYSRIPRASVTEYVRANLERGVAILVGYRYSVVFGTGMNVGHVGVIEGIGREASNFLIIEPEEGMRVEIDAERLMEGVRAASDGLWLFAEDPRAFVLGYAS